MIASPRARTHDLCCAPSVSAARAWIQPHAALSELARRSTLGGRTRGYREMVSPDTVRLLRWHAGLYGDALDPESVSDATAAGQRVSEGVAVFVSVLDRFNHELNGPRPSESVVAESDDVPRDVAYSASQVTAMLRVADHRDLAERVDTTWNAALAGDIDDLAEHIEQEHRLGP
jgi:hypothetical protein